MAIKAIINNTEKEIEQIKSDKQDIDYVYSRVGGKEAESALTVSIEAEDPPTVSIESVGGELTNYRIYGNTVDGESVGDLVTSGEHAGEYKVPVTVEGKNLWSGVVEQGSVSVDGDYSNSSSRIRSKNISLSPGLYTISCSLAISCVYAYNNNEKIGCVVDNEGRTRSYNTFYIPIGANNVSVSLCAFNANYEERDITPSDFIWGQIERGQKVTNYEPYHAPITTSIYLPEQIHKVGDEAEYIDYREQKQHRVRRNLLNILANTAIVGGIHFTVNSDKSITIVGNLNASKADLYLITTDSLILNRGEYLVFCENASTNAKFIIGGSPSTGHVPYTEIIDDYSVEVSCSGGGIGFCLIRVTSDIENPITLYPMIRLASIEDDTYEPYIENTDLDVTLPTLSTIKGINTLSVNTSIQPSNIYIKDNFDYKKVFTATRTIEDGLPLNYRNIEDNESTLKNYRIYGNTVDGESVGELVTEGEHAGEYRVPVRVMGKNIFNETVVADKAIESEYEHYQIYHQDGKLYMNGSTPYSQSDIEIALLKSVNAEVLKYINNNFGVYHFSSACPGKIQVRYTIEGSSKQYYTTGKYTSTSSRTADRIVFRLQKDYQYNHEQMGIQIERGNGVTSYEPYHEPITVPIYLPEPLKMVGDEAEYVDYGEQKMHRIGADDIDVTLPALPTLTGTNVLSVGTEAQPSDIYLKGKIKKKPKIYYKIYYYSQDGQTLLYTESVLKGSNGMYSGIPTKMADPQYTYTFAGWSSSTGQTTATPEVRNNIQNDKNVYAAFSQTLNTYTVYFYNESDTPIETIQNVPYGGTATYTGATPTKQGYSFTGWSPLPTNITADTSCYAQFKAPYITDSWEVISQRSAAGTAQNYYSIGDCKSIELNGTMGTLALNTTLYVYILGFNHNSTYEPNGITFGCFKTAATNGIDVCLVDSKYGSSDTSGTKYFNMSHRGNYNYSGWKGSDMRYDILGSTDVQPSGYGSSKVGHDATSTCATTPVANTLMSCLPSDLRSVMKPMTKYTDNKGNSSNAETNVTTSIDYLPLLSEYEVQGTGTYANKYEKNKQAQYTYYSGGNSKVKYRHSATSTAVVWWVRSPCGNSSNRFCRVFTYGGADINDAGYSYGVAPCFLV